MSPSDLALMAARREIRLCAALQEIASHRPCRAPRVVPGPALPISDDAVAAWIKEHEFLRGHLAPHVARSLAFLDSFKTERALTRVGRGGDG